MKKQKLNVDDFASKALSRSQKTIILGKGGATTLPEIDENGNIINQVSGPGPGGGATGPGEGSTTSGGSDVKGGTDVIVANP